MQMHFLAGAVLHATAVAVLGFFVLFAAGKADGIVKLAGTLLGWWLWIVAVLLVICAIVCPRIGDKEMPMMGDHMGGWMHRMEAAPPAPNTAPAPAKP